MKYYMTEFHSHTAHSDGDFHPSELVAEASLFGYEVLVITDHNTQAPVKEAQQSKHKDVFILPGMEWTTFYGHLLTIGFTEFIDWRKATIETIDESLRHIQQVGGIAGIAHPFSMGSPICTGCHWDFHIEDYRLIQFIEVWNRVAPDESFRSEQAYEWWVELLGQGYKIAASAGRDWHRNELPSENTALTYLGMKEKTMDEALTNIRNGNYYLTLGPKLVVFFEQSGSRFYMGDQLELGELYIHLSFEETEQEKLKAFAFHPKKVIGYLNNQIVFEKKMEKQERMKEKIITKKGYFRMEVWGSGKNQPSMRICIVNPIYIQ